MKFFQRSDFSQKGAVLMVTLIMLLLALTIGFIAIKTATTGISMSGNYKSGMQAFYTADSVSKYVYTNPLTFNIINYNSLPGTSVTWPDPGLPPTSSLSAIFKTGSGLGSKVTYLSTGVPPAGTSSKWFQTNYFLIQTSIQGNNNTRETQEILWASTVPKACGESC